MKHLIFSVCALLMGVFGFVSCSTEENPKEVLYTVTFNSCGGSEVESQTVKPGELVEKPENPTKDASFFTGWFTDESYDKEWDFEKDVVNNDMTLYAQWNSPKEALMILVNKAETMKEEDYLINSFKYMKFKLKDAKDVLNNSSATEEDFMKAYQKFAFVLDSMVPMLKSKEGPKEIKVSGRYGYLEDDVLMINLDYSKNSSYHWMDIRFFVLDEYGLARGEYNNGMKLDYDEKLKDWTIDGKIEFENGYMFCRFKKNIEPVEEKITVTVGDISKTITLKISNTNVAVEKFKSIVDSYPQGDVTFDNAIELDSKILKSMDVFENFIGRDNNSLIPNEYKEGFDNAKKRMSGWNIFKSVSIVDSKCITIGEPSKTICMYKSEGEFPIGKLQNEWYVRTDEKGDFLDANKQMYDFRKDGTFILSGYYDSKSNWEELFNGEYKYDGSNIIMHKTSSPKTKM